MAGICCFPGDGGVDVSMDGSIQRREGDAESIRRHVRRVG